MYTEDERRVQAKQVKALYNHLNIFFKDKIFGLFFGTDNYLTEHIWRPIILIDWLWGW